MNFLEKYKIKVIVESNEQGYMVHLKDYPGSYTRGESEKDVIRNAKHDLNYSN